MAKIQPLPRADDRVNTLYEHVGGTFYRLIQQRAPINGVILQEMGRSLGWACFSLADPTILVYPDLKVPRLVIGAYVAPDQRRKGIGTKLVRALIHRFDKMEHLPASAQEEYREAMQLPCLYDPAIQRLIAKTTLRFEPLQYP